MHIEVEFDEWTKNFDLQGRNIVHHAAHAAMPRLLAELIHRWPAAVNIRGLQDLADEGVTPILSACRTAQAALREAQFATIVLLLERGASPRVKDRQTGANFLHLLAVKWDVASFQRLFSFPGIPNLKAAANDFDMAGYKPEARSNNKFVKSILRGDATALTAEFLDRALEHREITRHRNVEMRPMRG